MAEPIRLREQMKQFRNPSNTIAVFIVALDYLMIFALVRVAIYLDRWPATLCAIMLIAGRQAAFSNLVHAAAHHALFRSKGWNNYIEFFAGYLILDSVATNRKPHLKHHAKFLRGSPERFDDLYGEFSLFDRGFLGRTWVVFIRPLFGYNGLSFMWGTAKTLRENPFFAMKLGLYWLALIGFCYRLGFLNYFLLYWVLPLLWIYPTFDRWAQVSDHFEVRGVARNHHGLFYNVFTKPHEVNHYTHHLYPSIPFYRLKAATRYLNQGDEEIENTSSFIDFVKIVYRGLTGSKYAQGDGLHQDQGQQTPWQVAGVRSKHQGEQTVGVAEVAANMKA